MLTGSEITSDFALKAGLSSLWVLAGCWIQLQNGCMYFPDKSGISPDIKTSQEFTDFFFSVHVKRFLCSFGNLCVFLADSLVKKKPRI